jgi:alpha-beta hydrolase superfamily lysophospholipase
MFAAFLSLIGCTVDYAAPGPAIATPAIAAQAFIMADGARLPYRSWLPPDNEAPWAVILALHGINDSQDAWELPAPVLAGSGVAVIAPDQRGFGETEARGFWPTGTALVDDARAMAAVLRARYPKAKLFLMGESMGAAVLMRLAASRNPPPADGWIFLAPAVWGRQEQPLLNRAALWLAYNTIPGARFSRAPGVTITASDNVEALRRLSTDPRSLHATRVDAIKGLVDLMTHAVDAAPAIRQNSLFLYGGKDELVPDYAMRAALMALPRHGGAAIAYYPGGYHLLLRDHGRLAPIGDILAWMHDPARPLPSGADAAAAAWLAAPQSGASP